MGPQGSGGPFGSGNVARAVDRTAVMAGRKKLGLAAASVKQRRRMATEGSKTMAKTRGIRREAGVDRGAMKMVAWQR